MRFIARFAMPAVFGAAVLFVSEKKAHALGPVDVEVGAKVGGATNPADGSTPLGFGIGARGGVSIFHFYGGLNVMHYFGSSVDTATTTLPSSSSKENRSTTLYGIEAGYSITAIPVVTIRPQIGVGNAHLAATFKQLAVSGSGLSVNGSTDNLYIQPGVTAIIPLGVVYVGADASVLILPNVGQSTGNSKTYASLAIGGQVGVRF